MPVSKLRLRVLATEQPQWVIAAQMGLHPSTLSLYLHGHRIPTPENLARMARFFNCEPTALFGYVDEDDLDEFVNPRTTPDVSEDRAVSRTE